MAESVKQKAAKGMAWSLAQRFSVMGIQFLSGIVLARLLTPEDYGAIGMLLIFMVVAEAFMDGGFGAALIQKKNPTQEDYSTIFWWNICMAVILYGVIYAIAPFVANFYHMPILRDVFRVQGLVLFVQALSLVQGNLLRKQLEFKKITIVNIFSSAISFPVTIYLAYLGFGVWSLVIQNLLMGFIPTVIYWCINKWMPSFVFSKNSFRALFSFGIFMFFSHLINEICNNIQGLLIGRFFNASLMGFYTKARSTEKTASICITQALQQVTFPLYSALQDDKNALINIIKQLTQIISFVVFPMMLCLILVAKPLFLLLYSERWLHSVPYFQAFCLLGLSGCLQAINTQAIAAIGKSKQMFGWTMVKRLLGIIMIVLGLLFWGIWGLVWASVVHNWIIYAINVALISKYLKYAFLKQIFWLTPALVLASASFVLVFMLFSFVNLNIYIMGLLEVVCFALLYFVLAYFFRVQSLWIYKEKLFQIFNKEKR